MTLARVFALQKLTEQGSHQACRSRWQSLGCVPDSGGRSVDSLATPTGRIEGFLQRIDLMGLAGQRARFFQSGGGGGEGCHEILCALVGN